MPVIEFVLANWLERAACWPGLMVYSRPVAIERRQTLRRMADRTEKLFHSLLSAQVV